MVITGEATGDCWSRSVFLNRRDAWRCSTEDGQIQDPCFGSGPRPVLLCSTDRGKPEMMLRLELLGPLPELEHLPPEPGSDSDYIGALMLVLADGQRCLFMSGATGAAADQRTSFQCPEGRLYGDPDTRNPVWTISYRAEGAADLVPVEIAAVYQ